MYNFRFLATTLLSVFSTVAIAQTTKPEDRVIQLEEVVITSQHGEQRLLDIPAAITAVSAETLESAKVLTMEQLAGFVPGLNILVQTPGRPNLVIRGLTSDEVSPTAQPRVSVYLNHAPISRATMAVTELYDMERIEVLKGPQGTLFGRGAQAGAISFISKKPTDHFGGYVAAGVGNYDMKHFEGALNVPVVAGLAARIAGIYSYRDGYVNNTSGGTLNDKNTAGGRFSLSFAPQNSNFKADLMVNYQRDDNAGTAFMSKAFPNAKGKTDIFKYEATLDENKDFYNKREVFGIILNARYYTGTKNYFSSITSGFSNYADSRFDGDGSAAPAIDMEERGNAKQFMQELRYNFSYGSRFTGVAGLSFWRENVNHTYTFRPDEQYMVYLFLDGMADYLGNNELKGIADKMIYGNGMSVFPGEMIGMPSFNFPLPTNHVEGNYTQAVNSAYDLFFDASYEILPKLTLTAGVRATFENFSIVNRAYHLEGNRSILGMFLGTYPNFFFKPVENPERKESFLALTWRAGLKYELDRHSNIYAGYSRGRRPNVLQYNSAGKDEVIDAETLHSFDAGYRLVGRRLIFDASLYYQKYKNFQSWKWEGMNYLQEGIDKATSYGAEFSGKYLLNRYLNIFGNYAYAYTTFDDKDKTGKPQLNAGNSFRLTPRNSFLLGFTASFDLASNVGIALTPSYSWKSHIFFEDANEPGIEQGAYGLLNANLALCFKQQGLTISLFGSNLTGEKYLIGAGNMGAMFGVPTFVPGAPGMMGVKLMWKF